MLYKNEYTKEISFPLGGIGTGSIGLDGGGRLIDWEIFNRPAKGSVNGYSHIAVKAVKNGKPITYVLNGDIQKDLMGQYKKACMSGYGFGPEIARMSGFKHFKDTKFDGSFPIAEISFKDKGFPAEIKLSAFNPFIPCDEKNSSLPAAFFEIEITNTDTCDITYQAAFTLTNPYSASLNKRIKKDGIDMIFLKNAEASPESAEYGDLTVATDAKTSFAQTYWYRGGWQDGIATYWNDFNSAEPFCDRSYATAGNHDGSTLVAELNIAPGETKTASFVVSWNCPNNKNYWSKGNSDEDKKRSVIWKNYYATIFDSSADTAMYSLKNLKSLKQRTLMFAKALHNASYPDFVKDAYSSNLSVLKSPTVLRLEDGSFYGWEGVNELEGSCEGTCQHVWNYAYALCFLFPSLSRSIRDLEYKYSTDEDGKTSFRLMLPLGSKIWEHRACVDGQLGSIIMFYRDWKLSGDNKWLSDNWENIKKSLEYTWSNKNPDRWDFDKDGVLEGRQHHTLDMELFGPSSWLEGIYLAALKATAEMADFLGDYEKKKEYGELFEKGYKWTKENLFNGKYFIHKTDITDKSIIDAFDASGYWNDEKKEIKYQIANGSSIDQLLAQWHADIVGLGEIFDKDQIDTALFEMMKNNFKPSMREFTNPWRVFSLNDESGTVICDYPEEAKKPKIPIPYCEETMTGFEYAFAGLLCSRGKTEDGFKVTKAIRDRFDGKKRNPWNEFECGSNYARSMASYALVPILSGFEFDLPKNHIGFNPYTPQSFKSIWSVDGAWGEFEASKKGAKLSVAEGGINLSSFGAKFLNNVSALVADGEKTNFTFENGILHFDEIKITKSLEIII